MTLLITGILILLALLGLPLFIALAGGSLLATYNAGLDLPLPAWCWLPVAHRSA